MKTTIEKGSGVGPGRTRSAGFSLLEVLVALLVLSIGLLGIAGLQVVSLRSNHGAYLRGKAVLSAYDMADRMRANSLAVTDLAGNDVGFYNSVGGNYAGSANKNCVQTATSAAIACTVAQMAAHDAFEWGQNLVGAQGLPSGTGTVCIDNTPDDGTAAAPACDNTGGIYVVKVWWSEIEQGVPQEKRFTLRLQI